MGSALVITGNTWIARRELKALGGRWNPANKTWVVPALQRNAVATLAIELGLDVAESQPERPAALLAHH